jgi:hypothetical protein
MGRYIIYEPISQPTNISFSNLADTSFTVSFTAASDLPDGYIVIRRTNTSPSFVPEDGTMYSVDQIVGDGIVAYVGSSTIFNEIGLSEETEYFYDIFSYNGSGQLINYLTSSPLEGSQTTLATEPTAQPTNLAFSDITTSSFTISYTAAAGIPDGYIVLRKNDTLPTSIPVDGTNYIIGELIGQDEVAYIGSAVSFSDTGVSQGEYHYAVYSYNGSGNTLNYLTENPLTGSQHTQVTEPIAQPTNLNFSNITDTSFAVSFTAAVGSPSGYLVIRKESSSPIYVPVDDSKYTIGQTVGDGSIAYVGNSTMFIENGLSPGTAYYYDIFSYNGGGQLINYLAASPLEGSQTTLIAEPVAQPINLTFRNTTESSYTVYFNEAAGSPTGYLAVMNIGSSPNFNPQDDSVYTVGQAVGDGFIAFIGSGTTFDETDLTIETEYHYDIFSYNASGNAINYLTISPLEGSHSTLATEPTSQPTNLTFTNITTSSFTISFTEAPGPPEGYIVLRKAQAPPDGLPVDGIDYSKGDSIGNSIVAYTGTATSFTDTVSSQGNYFYAIFSYNGSEETINYLTESPLEHNQSTLVTEPEVQPTNLTFSDINNTSLTISFTAALGSPSGYLVIRRAGDSPTFTPVDGENYILGQGVGDGIVAYSGLSTSFNDTGLSAETEYYYDIFSYNGSGELINYLNIFPLEGSQSTSGNKPIIFVNPNTLDFGSVEINRDSVLSLSVSNLGSLELVVSNMMIIGPDSSHFDIIGQVSFSLSDTTDEHFVDIKFTPTSSGNKSATLSISSNDSDNNPMEVLLKGSGYVPDTNGPIFTDVVYSDSSFINTTVDVSTELSDSSGISEANLYYRISGIQSFTKNQMITDNGSTFTGNIPGAYITENGVEFYIEAVDGKINTSLSKLYYIKVILTEGLSSSIPQPQGKDIGNYRIFSVPLRLEDPSPEAFLASNTALGNYDKTSYRWYDVQNNVLQEYPNIDDILAGRGFLFLCNISNFKLTSGKGKSVDSTVPFRIPLPQGWSLIGNPFNFDLPYDSLSVSNGTFELWTYNGDWQENTAGIKPWEGYAVYASQASDFIIKPGVSGLSKPSNYFTIENNDITNWLIHIAAEDDYSEDKFNFIGQDEFAHNRIDEYDLHEAPRIGKQLSLYFNSVHQLTTDIRRPSDQGHQWELICRPNPKSDKYSIMFNGLENIPLDFDAFLVDQPAKTPYNLRTQNEISFLFSPGTKKSFKVLVGTQEYLSSLQLDISLYPSDYGLFQNYPNPFNSITQITYTIPESKEVKLDIYNLIGQHITTLVNEYKKQGTYKVFWDASEFASGLYFYKINAGKFHDVKKMILLR